VLKFVCIKLTRVFVTCHTVVLKSLLQRAPFILTCHMSHTGSEKFTICSTVHIDLSHVTYWCWTLLVTSSAVHVDCHVSQSDGEIRCLQPVLLPLACYMPHSWNSLISYPVSTGIFSRAVRSNSVTQNRKTMITCELNSDWSQSDCIRAVSGANDTYGLVKPDRWFAISYFVCLNWPVFPLWPLFARPPGIKSVVNSTNVTVNENSAPLLMTPSYLRVFGSM
jgi:hypothetical protein